MFAFRPSFDAFLVPTSTFVIHDDHHAQQRARQRALAIKQAEAAELRRRQLLAEQEEYAYRAAVAAEFDRRRRQAAFAREQRRREEDRRRLGEARRARALHHQQRQGVPQQLLELLFHIDPAHHHCDEHADASDESSDDEDDNVEIYHVSPAVEHHDYPAAPATFADPEDVDLADSDSSASSDTEDELVAAALAAAGDSDSDADSDDSTSSAERDHALSTLAALAADFHARQRAFVSPSALVFQPSPAADRLARSPTPPLAFGAPNSAFLGHEEALLALLTRIDAVESHGDADVKRARKELVREIERELSRLDAIKEHAWEEQSGSSASEGDSMDASDDEEAHDQQHDEEQPEVVEILDLASASDSDSDLSLSDSDSLRASSRTIQIPFAAPVSSSAPRSSRRRLPSPAPSADDSDDEPLNHADDEVAAILLEAHKLGERVAELEEYERDQDEMNELVEDGSDSETEMQDQDDEVWDGNWASW
ncbi:hypothetical protein Rhopal_002291-T1 [Rhodotorula paludigena]|uniref:BAG domain-containing protein n=1 Tax=Rhodotorula paludigena TaxID=86838 RepID=A0AAV5G9N4_9BASI|nr:hypothetical protein Rhopal_002291-T1 [Rhodotorula paludigena]